ncbi:hypothetical protein ACFL31_03165 [Candidatus Margulisiibacteriota bacterium]
MRPSHQTGVAQRRVVEQRAPDYGAYVQSRKTLKAQVTGFPGGFQPYDLDVRSFVDVAAAMPVPEFYPITVLNIPEPESTLVKPATLFERVKAWFNRAVDWIMRFLGKSQDVPVIVTQTTVSRGFLQRDKSGGGIKDLPVTYVARSEPAKIADSSKAAESRQALLDYVLTHKERRALAVLRPELAAYRTIRSTQTSEATIALFADKISNPGIVGLLIGHALRGSRKAFDILFSVLERGEASSVLRVLENLARRELKAPAAEGENIKGFIEALLFHSRAYTRIYRNIRKQLEKEARPPEEGSAVPEALHEEARTTARQIASRNVSVRELSEGVKVSVQTLIAAAQKGKESILNVWEWRGTAIELAEDPVVIFEPNTSRHSREIEFKDWQGDLGMMAAVVAARINGEPSVVHETLTINLLHLHPETVLKHSPKVAESGDYYTELSPEDCKCLESVAPGLVKTLRKLGWKGRIEIFERAIPMPLRSTEAVGQNFYVAEYSFVSPAVQA